jgi:hypothetical protein
MLYFASLEASLLCLQGRRNRGIAPPPSPQILADQLTLFQPGGQIIPTTLSLALPDFVGFLMSLFLNTHDA